jgi:hypothetical protein
MTTDSLPGSMLAKTLCVVVLTVLLVAAGYAVLLSLANFRAISV